MSTPELSRAVRADTLGSAPRIVEVEADPAERAAVANRFGLESIERLAAQVSVTRDSHDVVASGTLNAEVTQSCVVTGEPVPARIEEPFAVRFRPEPQAGSSDEEVELAPDELDVIFYDGALIDVGEAVAQTLALNLDPYPRAPEAAANSEATSVTDEGEAGPFGGLAALRDRLSGA